MTVSSPGAPDSGSAVRTAAGLLVDLTSWLDTCPDETVDEWVAANIQESTATCLLKLPAPQRRRLLDTLGDLAATEQHAERRRRLRFFPFGMGLVDTEPADEQPPDHG